MYCDACEGYEDLDSDVREEVTRLVGEFLDECLSDDDTHKLGRILASSEAARNYLAEQFAIECTLNSVFQPDDLGA